jgi:pimeloyl-ACP methyl ester carboxylesterase
VSALAFDRAGSGPRVLLVHGLGGERHVWEPVWPALTARCDVMTVDLPGFGGSDPLPAGSDVSPQGLARAVAAFLEAEGFDRPHVAGNSLGGWIALELARLGVVRSVTALCPAGFWIRKQGPLDPGPRRVLRALRPLISIAFAFPAVRQRGLGGVMVHPERLGYRASVRIARAYSGSRGYAAVQTAMRAHRLEDGAGIDVPVTLAWAEHDRLVGPERVALHPTRVELIRDAGHVPMWDAPERVAGLVLEDALAMNP